MQSKEWTNWYLTDEGWIRGEERCDSGIIKGSKPTIPYYKKVTYREVGGSPKIFPSFEVNEILDNEMSMKLEAEFGEAPKKL